MDVALSEAEIGAVRWFRSLNQRTQNAIYIWLISGDASMIISEFTRHHRLAAA